MGEEKMEASSCQCFPVTRQEEIARKLKNNIGQDIPFKHKNRACGASILGGSWWKCMLASLLSQVDKSGNTDVHYLT